MNKFIFKFAVVLEVRKSKKNEALRLLGEAQRLYQSELARKSDLQLQLLKGLERRELLGRDLVGISFYKTEQDFIGGTKQRIHQCDQAIVRASRGVQKALRTYLIARKESKVMESLCDQAYIEYRRLLIKHERKQMDDLMVMRSRFKGDLV